MNIQDIKSNTTWQEASNTINNNNNKISLAIATLENATLKNKGYFTTLEKLNEAIPNPTIGSKAYVGTSEPYAIYIVENGAWVDSGYTGGDEIVAKITTDRIEDGAVTSEKIATNAFDSTLSKSEKIAPADVVGEKISELDSKVNGSMENDPNVLASKDKVIRVFGGYAGYFGNRAGYKSLIYDLSSLKGRSINISPVYAGTNQWIFYAFVHNYSSIIETASQSSADIADWNANLIQKQNGGQLPSMLVVPNVEGNVYIIITVESATDSALVLNDKKVEKGLEDKVKDLEERLKPIEHKDIGKLVEDVESHNASIDVIKETLNGSIQQSPVPIDTIPKNLYYGATGGIYGGFYTGTAKTFVYDVSGLGGQKVSFYSDKTGNNNFANYCFVTEYKNIVSFNSSAEAADATKVAQANAIFASVVVGDVICKGGATQFDGVEIPSVEGSLYLLVGMALDSENNLVLDEPKINEGLIQRVEELEKGGDDKLNTATSTSNSLAVREIIKGFKNKSDESYYIKDNAMNATSFEDSAYIDTKIREIPTEANSFVWVTDTHWYPTNGKDGDEGSARKSNYLINYIKQRANLGKVVFGGDCFNVADDKYKAAAMLSGYADEFFSSFGDDGVWCIGNHDPNSAARKSDNLEALIPDTEVYKRTVGLMNQKDIVYDTRLMANLDAAIADGSISLSKYDEENLRAWIKMHYYVDDNAHKTRYIIVESNDEGYATTSVLGVSGFSSTPWLCIDFIADSLISLPNGYNVVLVAHSMYYQTTDSYGPSNIFLDIAKILSYYKVKKDTYHSGITLEGISTILWRKELGDKHEYNFSKCVNNPNKIFMMFGHTHWNAAWICQSRDIDGTFCRTRPSGYGCAPYTDDLTQDEDAILCFTSNSDSYRLNSKSTTCPNGTACGNEMELGTITEHSFEVVSMLPNKVVLTKIGAGQSRSFNFR